ncbi:MAG TPA: NAD(P)-dependent alcohol dehydrogenase [Rubrobacteraceae bacterium]|nr:NAD(P)-dependent alcohol dehydrogenase [Rubrobacteraceae bacterium]
MKAARLYEYNEEIGTEPLKLEEVEEPTVNGPLDVVVRIGGAGLCRTDLHVIEGQWAPLTGIELPYTPGHENAGWIEEVGSAVSNVEVGDAVIVHPLITCGLCRACRGGDDMHCENSAFPGIDTNGGFAQLLKTNARAVVKLPEGVEPKDVAAHADAGLTAYHAVKKAVPMLHPGTRTVVIGVGGLGHIGIQSLKALCATEVIVVDQSEEALEVAKKLGADQTVLADGSQVDTVTEMTGGQGAEVVLDFVGEKGAQVDGWNMTHAAGSHFIIGYGGKIEIPTIDIISTERNIIGNLVGTYNQLAELMTLQARGKVSLQTHSYSLDEINDAVNDLNNGRLPGGRGILIPEAA